jgi:hypothetical protein
LTVNGTNFVSTSVASWNGSPRQTTVVSATNLTASITTADLAVAGNFSVTVANPAPGGGVSNAVIFTVQPAVAPTISFKSAGTATVPFGTSQDFLLNVTGSPQPTVTCSPSFGSAVVSADLTKVTLTVPNTQPAAFQATLPCTATNAGGSATTNPSVTVNLVAQILGVTNRRLFCGFAPCFDSTVVNLSGAFSSTTFTSTCAAFNLQQVDATHVGMIFGFGSSSKPQFCDVWTTEPAPGGGESNHVTLGFIGSQPLSVLSSVFDIQLDQASGNIYRVNLSDGSLNGFFNRGPVQGVAFDDQSNLIVVNVGSQIEFYPLTATSSNDSVALIDLNSITNTPGAWVSSAQQGDFGCAAQPQNKQVAVFQYVPLPGTPPLAFLSLSAEPWNVQMTTINNQPACVVQTINPPGIAGYAVPSGQPIGTGFVNAVGAASATTTFGVQSDNWQLSVMDGANGDKIAGALFRKDNTSSVLSLFFFDLATMSQMGNGVDLSGDPLRIGADNTNHVIVVAGADFTAQVTKFSSVDVNGNITSLSPTVPFLVTSLPYPYVSGSDKNFAHPF